MKKMITILLAAVMVVALVAVGCSNAKPAAKVETTGAAAQGVQYTCPMHPEVISDTQSKCPKCGMNLVVKGTVVTGHEGHNH